MQGEREEFHLMDLDITVKHRLLNIIVYASMDIYNKLLYMVVHVIVIVVNGEVENMPEYNYEDELNCELDPTKFLPQIDIPWGTPNRASMTVPPQLKLAESRISGAGLGIFATSFIPKYKWLGEYEGEIVVEHNQISDYAWTMYRGGEYLFYIDGYNEATSNWLRWVNCSRHRKEENVVYLACRGKAFYIARRDIYPGEELLVYYGINYAKNLMIDVDNYYNLDVNWNLYKKYSCTNIKV